MDFQEASHGKTYYMYKPRNRGALDYMWDFRNEHENNDHIRQGRGYIVLRTSKRYFPRRPQQCKLAMHHRAIDKLEMKVGVSLYLSLANLILNRTVVFV